MAADELGRLRAATPELIAHARHRLFARTAPTGPPVLTTESVRSGHYVVCGDDPLAHRLVYELARTYQRQVTVILRSQQAGHGPSLAQIDGVELIEAERIDIDALARAHVDRAAALALVQQDDVGNLHAALAAQELNPELRLVIRMFNMSLGHGIRALVRHCHVLSDASIAAPAFIASALGEVAPSYIRLPGRTLYVAHRDDIPRAQVLCGLADTSGPEAALLPADEKRCDLVLATANGAHGPIGDEHRARPPDRRVRLATWWRQLIGWRLGSVLSRPLRIAALALAGALVVGTGLLALLDAKLTIWQAFYLTVLDAFGGANPDPQASGMLQALQVLVVVAGLAMVPVITAAVVEAVVNARLALALGRLRGPIEDHVVVVGLGNLGTRVIQQLHDLGVPVVAIDKTDTARGAALARELGIPLIIGDAGREETLRSASIESARSLLCLSADDVVNLEAALHARTLKNDLRVVLRLFDGDFADRVQRAFGIASSKSMSYLAAPAFTAAMLEHEVIGTIPVKRQVLLVAEVPVEPGSILDGSTVAAAQLHGEARIIAITAGEFRLAEWSPRGKRGLHPGERLIVVATRAGLSGMMGKSASAEPDSAQSAPAST